MNTQDQNSINTLRINLEELEKRIKSLEKQLTSTQLATSLSACLAELKDTLSEIETEYNTIATSYQGHLAEFTAHMSNYSNLSSQVTNLQSSNDSAHQTMEANISSNSQIVNSVSTQMQTLQSTISALSLRLQEIEENGIGSGSSSGDTETEETSSNSPVVLSFEDKFTSTNFYNPIRSENSNKYYSQKIAFISTLSQYTKFILKVNCSTTNTNTSITPNITLKIGNDIIQTQNFPAYVNQSFSIDIQKNVVLKQAINYFQFIIEATPDFVINNFELTIQGINVKILNRDPKLTVFCADNKYFICDRRDSTKISYGYFPKADFTDLNNLPTLSSIDSSTLPENMCDVRFIPIYDYDVSSYMYFVNMFKNGRIFVCLNNTQSPKLSCVEYNTTLSQPFNVRTECCDNKVMIYDYLPTDITYCGFCFYYITTDFEAKIHSRRVPSANNNLKYNDENITNVVNISSIRLNDSIEEYRRFVLPKGYLVQDASGLITYYPAVNSTYKIDIGTGYDVTAYFQKATNKINIYIGNGCYVTKYSLSYDTENACFVKDDTTSVIYGISRYEELYNNKALVYKLDDLEVWDNQTF